MIRFFSALLLTLSSWPVAAGVLTIVGFNVESDDSSDRVIAKQLELSSGIDLWALNEVYHEGGSTGRLREAAAVDEGSGFGALAGDTGGGNRNAILYRKDRLVLQSSEELTGIPSGSGAAPLVARFLLDAELEFLFVVVRLSDRDDRRSEESRRLGDWAARQTLPLVAAGTFAFDVTADRGIADPDMMLLMETTRWSWPVPQPLHPTHCSQGRPVRDFVFTGGGAKAWSARSTVMFPQSNYCGDSDRTSDHRPVLVAFSLDGGSVESEGRMPERQVLPLFPADVRSSSGGNDRRGDRIVAPTYPEPKADSKAQYSLPAESDQAVASDRREVLLKRIDELEVEIRALRIELETLPE